MQGIREYNRKILSLRTTRKVTGSMKMISSVKMQRFAKISRSSIPFWKAVHTMVRRLVEVGAESHDVLLHPNPDSSGRRVLMVTSDRGMCGSYNKSTVNKAVDLGNSLARAGVEVSFSCIGAKGYAFARRHGLNIASYHAALSSRPTYAAVMELARTCVADIVEARIGELWIVYTHRVSSLIEEPQAERLLPFSPPLEHGKKAIRSQSVLMDESIEEMLRTVAPMLLAGLLHEKLIGAALSEHTARVAAMDSATANCDRMIDRYIQLRNRARQTAVTTELNEIVTGMEALRDQP